MVWAIAVTAPTPAVDEAEPGRTVPAAGAAAVAAGAGAVAEGVAATTPTPASTPSAVAPAAAARDRRWRIPDLVDLGVCMVPIVEAVGERGVAAG